MVDIDSNPLYYAAIGGAILGIATSLHYVLKGNVTGMSGIVYGVASLNKDQISTKLSIIGGLIAAGGLFFDIFKYGTYNKYSPFGPADEISKYTSYLGYATAGFLVGFGTKLGNGCTSGHGLCGIARLSIRSFVAVGVFLALAFAIGTLGYYETLGPFSSQQLNPISEYTHLASANICLIVGILLPFIMTAVEKKNISPAKQTKQIARDNAISFIVGFLFGIGLLVSGMTRRKNILSFLWIGKDWNPSLLFVLGCGVIINLIVFNYMIRVKKSPVYGQKLFNPTNTGIDWKLVLGAVSFGLGWGMGGLCPGPFMVLFSVFQIQIHVFWFGFLLIGMNLANRVAQWDAARQKQNNKIEVEKANIELNNEDIPPNSNDQETPANMQQSSGTLQIELFKKKDPVHRHHLEHIEPRHSIQITKVQ